MTPQDEKLVLGAFEKKMEALYHLAEHLVTLSSGALALTVTFADKHSTGLAGCFLKLSWVGFIAVAIGFTLIHLAKLATYQDFIEGVRSGKGASISLEPPRYFHIGRWLLVAGFLAGLMFLALFGSIQ